MTAHDVPVQDRGRSSTALQRTVIMRLSRLSCLYTDTPVYYLTVCTFSRRALLANRAVHETFIEFGERGELYGVLVGAYVLMPDHCHLFAALVPNALALSNWVKSLKNTVSKCLRSSGTPAPHFQRSFFDHVIRSAESYREKSEYMFLNPVRAGLVQKPEDWEFQGAIHRLGDPSG